MDSNFPYNNRINYNTFVTGVWIPYNGWRVKSLHDVKLRDGTIVTQLRPNGGAWYGSKFDIKDDDVIAIRTVNAGIMNIPENPESSGILGILVMLFPSG